MASASARFGGVPSAGSIGSFVSGLRRRSRTVRARLARSNVWPDGATTGSRSGSIVIGPSAQGGTSLQKVAQATEVPGVPDVPDVPEVPEVPEVP
jgi:hypothetical protein